MSGPETFRYALSALQLGEVGRAERLFKKLISAEPRHVAGLNLLAILLMKLGRHEEAESYIQRALNENATSDATFYNYGIILKALGRPGEALEHFNQALEINPTIAETWMNRGTVFRNLRRYSDALTDFEKAISLNSNCAEAFCNRGNVYADLKEYNNAFAAYDRALNLKPDLADAWLGRGNIYAMLKQYDKAAAAYDRALNLKPDLADAWLGRGNVYVLLKQYDKAAAAYDRALNFKSDMADAWLGRGNVYVLLKHYDKAVAAYDRARNLKPDLADAWLGRGNAFTNLKRFDQAFDAYNKALELKPDLAEAWLARGNIYTDLKRFDEAFDAYDKALGFKPDLAEAWFSRGNVYGLLKQYDTAVTAYDRALNLKPDLADAWLGRGNAFTNLKRFDQAFDAYDKALDLKPDLAEAWLARGNIFTDLKRFGEAFAAYDKALGFKPDLAEAWLGRGNVFTHLKRFDEAFDAYDEALGFKPDLAEAWLGRGNVYANLNQNDNAFSAYDRALHLDSGLAFAEGLRLHSKLHLCDWTNINEDIRHLLSAVRERAPSPFVLLSIPSSPMDQLQCAKAFVAGQRCFPALWKDEIYSHDRIRVAYLSADFRNHPVAYLMAGLFEHHDKSRFEISGISFGPFETSTLRRRLETAFEHFIDARDKTDEDIANLIRNHEIDIAIDLMGHTRNSRSGILARRPAPIQVHYMGYAGTSGTNYIDYILADSTVIPEEHRAFFTEQVVWLPDSYLVSDDSRAISPHSPTRHECRLPEDALVFCSFNNSFKIMPTVFEVWMRVLRAVPKSVLWLSQANATAMANLRREAECRGVSPQRLIFAPRVADNADHLARQRQADLFLDTLPYNAHTTASDALWAGLPVLTCLGKTFAGRVAGSLLKAIGLDELITRSLEDYEAIAIQLAREPSRLAALKDRLVRNRNTYPLFNTQRFARHIETAFLAMWERYQRGMPPETFQAYDEGSISFSRSENDSKD